MDSKLADGKLTIEDGKRALADHINDKACEIQNKYGLDIDYETLGKLIRDPDFVKFPVSIQFDNSKIDPGLFAVAEEDESSEQRTYVIYVHEYFKDKPESLPMLVLYHLVTINYGDFATAEDAELFASSVLGMSKDDYYQRLCQIVDQIPDNQAPVTRVELEDGILNGSCSPETCSCKE